MTTSGTERTFRYLPGSVPFHAALVTLGLVAIYRAVQRPDWMSTTGVLLVVFMVLGGAYFAWGGVCHFIITWRISVTPTHLIATHPYRRARVALPWDTIVRVTKQPRAPFAPGRLRISQVETSDHRTIVVGAHLGGYSDFLEELRSRAVNCQVFDAYLSATDG